MSARIFYFPSPVVTVRESDCDTDMASMARAVGLGCVRGTAITLAFEAVAGLGIYAGWHLLRLLY